MLQNGLQVSEVLRYKRTAEWEIAVLEQLTEPLDKYFYELSSIKARLYAVPKLRLPTKDLKAFIYSLTWHIDRYPLREQNKELREIIVKRIIDENDQHRISLMLE